MSLTAGVTITTDLDALDAQIARFALIEPLIEKFANLIADDARRLVAVDTGALKASIRVSLEAMAAEVIAGEGLDYAHDQEYGTARQPGTAFIRPAAERYFPAFLAELQALIGG